MKGPMLIFTCDGCDMFQRGEWINYCNHPDADDDMDVGADGERTPQTPSNCPVLTAMSSEIHLDSVIQVEPYTAKIDPYGGNDD